MKNFNIRLVVILFQIITAIVGLIMIGVTLAGGVIPNSKFVWLILPIVIITLLAGFGTFAVVRGKKYQNVIVFINLILQVVNFQLGHFKYLVRSLSYLGPGYDGENVSFEFELLTARMQFEILEYPGFFFSVNVVPLIILYFWERSNGNLTSI